MSGTPLTNVMAGAAIKAGRGLLRDFGEIGNLEVSRKGTANFVTAADIRTEKLLHKELSKVRPDFGFLMEESGEVVGSDISMRWIIDPLDGTFNFVHNIPYFCISIAVEKNAGGRRELIAGCTYDPIHNELFTAEKGKGAFLNDRKLRVSSRETLEDAILVTGSPRYAPKGEGIMESVTSAGATVRSLGATALDLAYLAAGRTDGCWYHTMKPWDIAAGIVLVVEAGGSITEFNGKYAHAHSQTLLASNKHLHPHMQKLLPQAA